MYCKFCGKEINDNSNFCPSCGSASRDEVPTQSIQIQKMKYTNLNSSNTKKNGLAKTALILSIVALVICFIFYLSIPCAIAAIIIGRVSVKQNQQGKEYADLAIKLGLIAIILSVIVIVILFAIILKPRGFIY